MRATVITERSVALEAPASGEIRLEFDEVYRRYAPAVVRWVSRLGGPQVDLEDAVQEVFVIVDRQLASFVPDAKITTWLFRITRNVVRQERRKNRFWRWLRGSAQDAAGRLRASGRSPLEDAEQRAARERVYRILDGMNERYRTALILADLEELAAPEIAERMGVSRANLWVVLHRARADFTRRLARDEESDG